jgi:hypothetical protein
MAIRMKALRSFGQGGVNEGHVKRGREFAVTSDQRRKELEAHALAYRLDPAKPAAGLAEAIVSAENNEAAKSGPFGSVGGGIGAADPAPSSPPVTRRQPRRLARSAGGSPS